MSVTIRTCTDFRQELHLLLAGDVSMKVSSGTWVLSRHLCSAACAREKRMVVPSADIETELLTDNDFSRFTIQSFRLVSREYR